MIDYAGLFPPAGLGMQAAVENYARYRKSEFAWMLGRFIAPVSRLAEFESAAASVESGAWRLSALVGDDIRADIERIRMFNLKNEGRFEIDVIELKAAFPADIRAAIDVMPAGLTPYFEIPIAEDPLEMIRAIGQAGGRAKVRTGGVTADGIPPTIDLARFIKTCAEEDVAFKATAGLHHPIRAPYRLTYAPDSPTAVMHGFLNVFLAASFAYNGMDIDRLVAVLEETAPSAFEFESGSVQWRDQMVVRGQLRVTRSEFAIAFGSCSFEEPVEDLKRMSLI
ncbi:MAG: hypothetical protein IPM66_13615 [Acidobacteriota bacterium]|nr:MAG: hypothetical protein IPM66_13615 [Acidobacteriota bacterium]